MSHLILFNVYYNDYSFHLSRLSIDKLFIISRNDIIISFYTNYHYFDCIFNDIIKILQSNNRISFVHYILHCALYCCIVIFYSIDVSQLGSVSFVIHLCIVVVIFEKNDMSAI